MRAADLSQMGQNGQDTKSPQSPHPWRGWTFAEDEAIWARPDWTAAELAAILPGRTPGAVRRHRSRIGRYRPDAVPLCQRCGEHPVWEEAADGRRWGLCRACTTEEREWRVRHAGDFSRRDNALRQAAFKGRRRASGGRP